MVSSRITKFIVGALVAAASGLAGSGWGQTMEAAGSASGPGPSINVVAHVQPILTIELDTGGVGEIHFHADNGAGVYDGDRTLGVRVATNYGLWKLSCYGTPLVGTNGSIPPERLLMTNLTGSQPGQEVALTGPVLVAEGGPQAMTEVSQLSFRLRTEWTDRPGTYTGQICFTYLATP